MNIFQKGYTLEHRPEVELTKNEMWEVYNYCQSLMGIDSLQYWIDDYADYADEELMDYAKAHREDTELGYDIWDEYIEFCTYDMGHEEMEAVARAIRNAITREKVEEQTP